MGETVQNAKMLRYSDSAMLEEWKLRKGFSPCRTDCTIVRDDGIDLDALLKAEMESSYEHLLVDAPAEMLPVADISAECEVSVGDDLSATVVLPERCVRVLEVELPGWSRPVCRIEYPGSPLAERQASEWLRGRAENPVCVAGYRCIRAYSAASRAVVSPVRLLAVVRPPEGYYVFAPSAWDLLLRK